MALLAPRVSVAASSRAASSARMISIVIIAADVGIHGRSGRTLLKMLE